MNVVFNTLERPSFSFLLNFKSWKLYFTFLTFISFRFSNYNYLSSKYFSSISAPPPPVWCVSAELLSYLASPTHFRHCRCPPVAWLGSWGQLWHGRQWEVIKGRGKESRLASSEPCFERTRISQDALEENGEQYRTMGNAGRRSKLRCREAGSLFTFRINAQFAAISFHSIRIPRLWCVLHCCLFLPGMPCIIYYFL